MICGTRSFRNVDSTDPWSTPPSSAKASKKKARSKNPYSTRGLDRFSALLAELEARKAKIMAKAELQGAAMVRFMYSNSNDWLPIIVKLPPSDINKPKAPLRPPAPAVQTSVEAAKDDEASLGTKEVGEGTEATLKLKESLSLCAREAKECCSCKRWRPGCNRPLVVVLMLLCFVLFGRAFAICCTAIWWYLVPILKGESDANVGEFMRKKAYGRRTSDKRMVGNLAVAPSFDQAKKVRRVQGSSPRGHVNGKRG